MISRVQMAEICDSYCDDRKEHFYLTTHGQECKVQLYYSVFTDSRCITLKSQGRYQIEIKYQYEMVEESFNEQKKEFEYETFELKTIYSTSKLLQYQGDVLLIPSEFGAPRILQPEPNVNQQRINDCFAAYPVNICISKLECITD